MRGRVTFTADGKDYTLRFSTNALCAMEERSGRSVAEIASAFDSGKAAFADLRLIFWAGLLPSHNVSLDEAGDLMDEIGIDRASAAIGEAFAAAFPQAEQAEANAGPQRKATAA